MIKNISRPKRKKQTTKEKEGRKNKRQTIFAKGVDIPWMTFHSSFFSGKILTRRSSSIVCLKIRIPSMVTMKPYRVKARKANSFQKVFGASLRIHIRAKTRIGTKTKPLHRIAMKAAIGTLGILGGGSMMPVCPEDSGTDEGKMKKREVSTKVNERK